MKVVVVVDAVAEVLSSKAEMHQMKDVLIAMREAVEAHCGTWPQKVASDEQEVEGEDERAKVVDDQIGSLF